MGRRYRANPDTENDACRRPSQSQAPAMRRPARTAKPQGRIPEHEASFQTRGPIVRGDGANKNGEFRRRKQENPGLPEWARLNAPFPAFGGGVGVRLTFGPAGTAFGRAALSAIALEAWRASAAPFRRRCGRAALARSPRGSVRSSALAARHAPRRTCRSSRAELPRRPCLHSRQITLSGRIAACRLCHRCSCNLPSG